MRHQIIVIFSLWIYPFAECLHAVRGAEHHGISTQWGGSLKNK